MRAAAPAPPAAAPFVAPAAGLGPNAFAPAASSSAPAAEPMALEATTDAHLRQRHPLGNALGTNPAASAAAASMFFGRY